MRILILFNRPPYDGTDVTWNGLRLAGKLVDAGHEVRLFFMNDAVDLARESCMAPPGYDQELAPMVKDLIARRVAVKVCGTCMARCGIHKNEPYYEGAHKATMADLAEWLIGSAKVVTF